ncbi:hypothetical protein KFE98_03455 [bacterium SCSIO 12741]|nr:hypothetical protein KFE98_03455 [bacterium SCSIO 12741]
MKRFIYKSVVFLLIPSIYFVIIGSINRYIGKDQKVDLQGASTLIAGDSHPMSSLNPDLLYNTKSVCQSAEPYIISYWKVKEILESNPVDTLILGFAPHNISAFNDFKFSDRQWSSQMFHRSYYLNDYKNISEVVDVDLYEYYKILMRHTCLYPKMNHINYVGKFSSLRISDVESYESAIKRHYYYRSERLGVSEVAISYLDSIIDYCQRNQTEIILTSNPVHHSYYENIPPAILSRYNQLSEKYSNDGLFVFNLTSSSYPDSLFTNVDHLNFFGATRFSKEFRQAKANRASE